MEYKNVELKSGNIWHYVSKDNVRWMNDPDVTRYLTQRGKYTAWKAFFYYIQHILKGDRLWAIYVKGQHVGNCGLFEVKNGRAQLRITIGEKKWWGKGIGYLTMLNMLDHAEKLGLKQIWLEVHPKNIPAIRIYRKAGFLKESDITLPNGIPQIKMSKMV